MQTELPWNRNLRKVGLLLQALEDLGKKADYYALDLSKPELERTLAQLPAYQHVGCHGLFGTYDDGKEWLKEPFNQSRRKCILSLGSSVGKSNPLQSPISKNGLSGPPFKWDEAHSFWRR